MRWKQRRPSGDCEIPSRTISCAGIVEISSPRNLIEPVRGGVRPEIERNVVDLPAPLEPISVTTSPSSTLSVMPLSASIEPYAVTMSFTSSSGIALALLPQVGLDDLRVVADRLRLALGDLLAVVEHRHLLGDSHDHLHVVLDQQDRHAQVVAQLAHELGELLGLLRVHAGGRLVEQQQLRLGRE